MRTVKECSDNLDALIFFVSTSKKTVLRSKNHPANEELAFKRVFTREFNFG